MPASRRLAVIMFTDIVGYTAMMQQNEKQAIECVKRHEAVLEKTVAFYHGEVRQYYGDGSLNIFGSVSDCLRAALELQRQFRQAPYVPLRIGIHIGEVLIEKGKLFGNGINIASRIESLGLAGTVLFSKEVMEKIQNQSEFQFYPLGKFHFKNVRDPMEIFALTNEELPIPKRREMLGKLKKKAFSFKTNLAFISLIILFLIVSGVLLINSRKARIFPDSIKEQQLAVIPFKNNSNDSNLDMLSDMAAEYIIQGLMSLKDIKIVSSPTTKEHLQNNSWTGKENQRLDFQRQTGAKKIIFGSFYQNKNDLIFNTQIIDLQTGEVEFVFPKVKGNRQNLEGTIYDLRSRILTYFSGDQTEMEYFFNNRPPNYESYKKFNEGFKVFRKDFEQCKESLEQAIELDSSFFRAYYVMFFNYMNNRKVSQADSVLQLIDKRFNNLMPDELLALDWMKALYKQDYRQMYILGKGFLKKDPKHPIYNFDTGLLAMYLNRPREALEIFNHINLTGFKNSGISEYRMAFALLRNDSLERAIKILNQAPIEERITIGAWTLKMRIYAMQNQPDSVMALIRSTENAGFKPDRIASLYLEALKQFALIQDTTNLQKWADHTLSYFNSAPTSNSSKSANMAELFFLNYQYDQALNYYRDLLAESKGKIFNLMRVGYCYGKLGLNEKAINVINELKMLDTPQNRGNIKYHMAMVYAGMGEKSKAMDLIT